MNYHPLMGIGIFIICIIVAFIIGKHFKYRERKKENTFIKLEKKRNSKTDSISPDASWID